MLAGPSIDLLDLFAPAATASHLPVVLAASSLALVGPIPSSSLHHLALNHLRQGQQHAEPRSPTQQLSERARGKQRVRDDIESDDDEGFDEAILQELGQRQERHVLILTSEEAALRSELVRECDVSLFGSRSDSETARLLDLVDIRYLPSSAHLSYFLSTVHVFASPHAPDAQAAYQETGAKSLVDPSCLVHEPTLVILHAPSDYLEEPANEGCGIEAYASLVVQFVSTFTRLVQDPPLLVVCDPLAAPLSLPILPARLQSRGTAKKRSLDDDGGAPVPDGDRNSMPLKRVLARFFDYVGEAEEIAPDSPPQHHTPARPRRFLLSCEASPSARLKIPPAAHRLGLEFVLHQVGEDDPERADVGGMRIEVVES